MENHRISRSLPCKLSPVKSPNDVEIDENSRISRYMNDTIGTLSDISAANAGNAWSIRRVSSCSGIYEEILEPAQTSHKQ